MPNNFIISQRMKITIVVVILLLTKNNFFVCPLSVSDFVLVQLNRNVYCWESFYGIL